MESQATDMKDVIVSYSFDQWALLLLTNFATTSQL